MANGIGTLAITMSLLGIAFVIHFTAAGYYFIGSARRGSAPGPSV